MSNPLADVSPTAPVASFVVRRPCRPNCHARQPTLS